MKNVPILSLFTILSILTACKKDINPNDYLKTVLNNLEKIESASYYKTGAPYQPGDTTALFTTNYFVNEYNNPLDTTIGASFIVMDLDDHSKINSIYDGNIHADFYHDKKGVIFDDFITRELPFRPISPPFFNYTTSIIKYALTTNDSITLALNDLGDDYYFKLIIDEDKHVEFFGKEYYMPDNPYNWGETTSIYELWISKTNDLPYKVRREISHQISETSISNVQLNNMSLSDFSLYNYIPGDYEVRKRGEKVALKTESELIGKRAPQWTLTDKDEKMISLSDIQSKVLLINFTGIGCGPCQASVTFLKELRNRLNSDDFELVSIETWIRRPQSLRIYADKNHLNYKFLSGTDEVIRDYETGGAAPVFFILDENRMIREVFRGYKEGIIDKKINDAITDLL